MSKTRGKKIKHELKTAKDPETATGLALFAEAKINAQKQRHECIDAAFSSALNVLDDILSDTTKTPTEKLLPAKLAIDTYMMKEKLIREDARYDLEKEKINIERAKLSVPGGPLYIIQQNIENQQNNSATVVQASTAKKELTERKKLQAALLEKVSGIAQFVEADIDKKD